MGIVKAAKGDSIPSLAKDNGFFPDTIWNHPQNAQLRQLRKSQNQLLPGDPVFIPDLTKRTESRGVDASHSFKRKGVPAKLTMRLLELGEPRKNEPYVLIVDGMSFKGTLDGDGRLEQFIPPNAKSGQLLLNGGKEVIPVQIGYLNPVSDVSGLQQRLNNLGFVCGNEDGDFDELTKAAILKFQKANKLPETGQPDDATCAKLQELHP
jgi:hypothetical protein